MKDSSWAVATVECCICGHEQVSVYPIEVKRLECGECGYMNGAPSVEGETMGEG